MPAKIRTTTTRRARAATSVTARAARGRTPRAQRQPPPAFFDDRDPVSVQMRDITTPGGPRELHQIIPNPRRQGSEKISPLRFVFPASFEQQIGASRPFGANRKKLAPAAAAANLPAPTARRIATLPEDLQSLIAETAPTERPADVPDWFERATTAIETYTLTPGAPTTEGIENVLADLRGGNTLDQYTEEERSDARSRLMQGAGPDAPEPTEDEILEDLQTTDEQNLERDDILSPPFQPPDFDFDSVEPTGELPAETFE